jgi:hypothetical protein
MATQKKGDCAGEKSGGAVFVYTCLDFSWFLPNHTKAMLVSFSEDLFAIMAR